PLELFLLHANGTSERFVVGPDIAAGQRVQFLIPGNTFHTARLLGPKLDQAGLDPTRWFLGASTEWPGVIPADVEIGDLEVLGAKYAAVAPQLRAIAASVQVVA
ncbi:MAG: cupin domain-containing protein, partial [Xanthobacteraceae bacterium]